MKITKLTKLLISFMGGGKIDFPTRHLRDVEIDGDGLDGGGGGGQEETDEVKIYLDELATRIKSSENYGSLYERVLMSFMSKEFIEENPSFEGILNTLTEQGKVKGDANNYDYIFVEYDEEQGVPGMLVLLTEEQFNYSQKSIIKASAKDFITSSFMIDKLNIIFAENFSDENDIKNKLAIGKEDFKFAIGVENEDETMGYTIFDDIDMTYFANLFPYRSDEQLIIFDENETRKIFDVAVTPLSENANNKYSYLKVQKESNNYIKDTIQIGNKNYKYLKYDESIPS